MIREYGYEYNSLLRKDIFSITQWKNTNKTLWGAYCLRSGRDALKFIAKTHAGATVYLPALCCDSMITPFEKYGCRVVFYRLNDSLTVHFPSLLKGLQSNNGVKLLLFCDYFGISMIEPDQLVQLKSCCNNLILINDITHHLLSANAIESCFDYTIASLRKWLGIPDGGLLWSNRELKSIELFEEHGFAELRLQAQCMRTEYFLTEDENLKASYRQIFSTVSSLLDDDLLPRKMTKPPFEAVAWRGFQHSRM